MKWAEESIKTASDNILTVLLFIARGTFINECLWRIYTWRANHVLYVREYEQKQTNNNRTWYTFSNITVSFRNSNILNNRTVLIYGTMLCTTDICTVLWESCWIREREHDWCTRPVILQVMVLVSRKYDWKVSALPDHGWVLSILISLKSCYQRKYSKTFQELELQPNACPGIGQ